MGRSAPRSKRAPTRSKQLAVELGMRSRVYTRGVERGGAKNSVLAVLSTALRTVLVSFALICASVS